jgi:hypothetical protein
MTDTTALGRLEKVDLRQVWTSEATGFTPWLALPENISLLAETIGMDLEVEAQEKEVGPFRADILCKETTTGDWVLIENQLERTDHTHLGQLLTYAAGLKAVTIVWVAKQFSEEHRAALDWLNEITPEKFRFFALEVEAWRIGDSLPAPKFNVVSKPNDWSRQVTGAAARAAESDLTDSKRLQLDFWTAFRDYADQHARRFKPTKPLPQHWMTIAIGRSGFHLSAIASTWSSRTESFKSGELRAELVIDHERAGEAYGQLEAMRGAIEDELGEQLTWYSGEGIKERKLRLARTADLGDRTSWMQYTEWLTTKLDRLHEVFQVRIKALDLSPREGGVTAVGGGGS